MHILQACLARLTRHWYTVHCMLSPGLFGSFGSAVDKRTFIHRSMNLEAHSTHVARQWMKEQVLNDLYNYVLSATCRSIYLVARLACQWMTREQMTQTSLFVWWVINSGPVLV